VGVKIPPVPVVDGSWTTPPSSGLRNLPFPGVALVKHGDPVVSWAVTMSLGPHIKYESHEFVPGKLKAVDPDMVALVLDADAHGAWKLRVLSK